MRRGGEAEGRPVQVATRKGGGRGGRPAETFRIAVYHLIWTADVFWLGPDNQPDRDPSKGYLSAS